MSTSSAKNITGQCLCGLVQYSIDQLEPNMGNCHCMMCRKFHGENGTVRKFCSECGSSLIFQDDTNDYHEIIHFAAGTLNDDIEVRPDVHIYMESKVDWLDLNDDLPKHKTGRNSPNIE